MLLPFHSSLCFSHSLRASYKRYDKIYTIYETTLHVNLFSLNVNVCGVIHWCWHSKLVLLQFIHGHSVNKYIIYRYINNVHQYNIMICGSILIDLLNKTKLTFIKAGNTLEEHFTFLRFCLRRRSPRHPYWIYCS